MILSLHFPYSIGQYLRDCSRPALLSGFLFTLIILNLCVLPVNAMDPGEISWTSLKNPAFADHHLIAMVEYQDKMWIIGQERVLLF